MGALPETQGVVEAQDVGKSLRRARDYPYNFPRESVTYENGSIRPFDLSETEGRTPVLGFGSNQSPERLAQKFGHLKTCIIPVERVTLEGFDSVFSAHVTSYGAVAAMIQVSEGSELEAALTWLDAEQLEIMHETELGFRSGFGSGSGLSPGNYHYGEMHDIALQRAAGGGFSSIFAYFSTRGYLKGKNGAPISIDSIPCQDRRFSELPTAAAIDLVRTRYAPNLDADAFIMSCIQDTVFRQDINQMLAGDAGPFNYPYTKHTPRS